MNIVCSVIAQGSLIAPMTGVSVTKKSGVNEAIFDLPQCTNTYWDPFSSQKILNDVRVSNSYQGTTFEDCGNSGAGPYSMGSLHIFWSDNKSSLEKIQNSFLSYDSYKANYRSSFNLAPKSFKGYIDNSIFKFNSNLCQTNEVTNSPKEKSEEKTKTSPPPLTRRQQNQNNIKELEKTSTDLLDEFSKGSTESVDRQRDQTQKAVDDLNRQESKDPNFTNDKGLMKDAKSRSQSSEGQPGTETDEEDSKAMADKEKNDNFVLEPSIARHLIVYNKDGITITIAVAPINSWVSTDYVTKEKYGAYTFRVTTTLSNNTDRNIRTKTFAVLPMPNCPLELPDGTPLECSLTIPNASSIPYGLIVKGHSNLVYETCIGTKCSKYFPTWAYGGAEFLDGKGKPEGSDKGNSTEFEPDVVYKQQGVSISINVVQINSWEATKTANSEEKQWVYQYKIITTLRNDNDVEIFSERVSLTPHPFSLDDNANNLCWLFPNDTPLECKSVPGTAIASGPIKSKSYVRTDVCVISACQGYRPGYSYGGFRFANTTNKK